jgi:hypothetical protein
MREEELIAFAKDAVIQFEEDMRISEENGMHEDYAYAEGARNAYKVILNNLDALEPEDEWNTKEKEN